MNDPTDQIHATAIILITGAYTWLLMWGWI